MEDARINEDSTKLATLEQFISFLEEKVVSIKHDNPVIIYEAPRIKFVQCQLESPIRVDTVWIVQIFNSHHLCTIFLFSAYKEYKGLLHFQGSLNFYMKQVSLSCIFPSSSMRFKSKIFVYHLATTAIAPQFQVSLSQLYETSNSSKFKSVI